MENTIVKPFMWKVNVFHGGGELSVDEMETKHLFYTFLMIWNHSAPKKLRIWEKRKYDFGPHYTPEYMFEAFKNMLFELTKRKDLGPKMLAVLQTIESNFSKDLFLPRSAA